MTRSIRSLPMAQSRPAVLRTLVVDPDPQARSLLRALLAGHADVEVVAECDEGVQAAEEILEREPDLVLAEVALPGIDGFALLDAVGGADAPAAVFVTASERHALRAFDAGVLDYVVKPVQPERLARALERVRAHLGGRSERELQRRLEQVMHDMDARPRYPARLTVRAGTRISFVYVAEIDWVEADANYARLHAGERSVMVRETMGGLEARLDPASFLRIHRSTIVRIDRIREVDVNAQGEYSVVLRDGTRLTSSRTYRRKLAELMGITP